MRIKILPNPKKPWAKELSKELKASLAPHHKVVRKGADATICIGGDGTILYNSYKGRLEGPVLGIGGDTSYICQLHKNGWRGRLAGILEDKKRETVMTLECRLGEKRFTALNDIVVHTTRYRVAELEVSFQDQDLESRLSFEGDGMIISTALGSAAYAFSAGGEKLGPTERKISLVPICPYKRAFSPRLLSEHASISIKADGGCALILDGILVRRLGQSESIIAKKGAGLVFFEGIGKSF